MRDFYAELAPDFPALREVRLDESAMFAAEFRKRMQGFDDASALRLFSGALRAISGWIGKHQADRVLIRTATATIGIRGTDHEAMVIAPGDPTGAPGTYDKVNAGSTFIFTLPKAKASVV